MAPRAEWPSQCVASGQLVMAAKVFWEEAARAPVAVRAGRPSLADSSGSARGLGVLGSGRGLSAPPAFYTDGGAQLEHRKLQASPARCRQAAVLAERDRALAAVLCRRSGRGEVSLLLPLPRRCSWHLGDWRGRRLVYVRCLAALQLARLAAPDGVPPVFMRPSPWLRTPLL